MRFQKLGNKKTLYVKDQEDNRNEPFKCHSSAEKLNTEDFLTKVDTIHIQLEDKSVEENKTIDAPDLINLNSDHSFEAIVCNTKGLDASYNETLNILKNNNEQIQSGTLSAVIDCEDRIRNSAEVVYCEIADIRGCSQIDSVCRSMETLLVHPVTATRVCTGMLESSNLEITRQRDRNQVGMEATCHYIGNRNMDVFLLGAGLVQW